MVKKLAALAGAGALLFAIAGPAFGFLDMFSDDLTIRNRARVRIEIDNEAETGDNEIHGKYVYGGRIRTGDADAVTDVWNDVNYNEVGCDCIDGDVKIRNKARVRIEIDNEAETGDNEIHGMKVCGGRIRTGGADATSYVDNFVNTNIVGGGV